MKIIFMGTPDFAVKILAELKDRHEIICVVTQPDKPQGRKKIIAAPPVKEFALNNGIEVLQPERIKDKDFISLLEERSKKADVFAVAAYGQILPEKILTMPRYGCVNVHASLLPKYRGAAPIQWAIINGEEITGITIMKMDKGLDTGDIILQKEIEIKASDTGGSLFEKMSDLGAEALIEAFRQIESGTAKYTAQDGCKATYAPMITKETGRINFNDTSKNIINLMRALAPEAAAYTFYKGEAVKIWNAQICELQADGMPGEILEVNKSSGIIVKTRDSCIVIKEVQPESGKRMDAIAYTRGRNLEYGGCFDIM